MTPRTAVQVTEPFCNNGVWIAMFQFDSECVPFPVEVAAPNSEGQRE